jgi:redox-sensitive bicupin YhaK (pirin superfamily)
MSLEFDNIASADCQQPNCNKIKTVITPKQKDLGGFSVRRVLPAIEQRMVGPWLFFDHMGPAVFPAGSGINVRPHPHVNLATVTYLFEGEILHRDSLGSYQPIRPGDVNLMIAGKGIVHSERERPEVTAVEHNLHGLQLWLALPEAQQEIAPDFIHYPDATIPTVNAEGVSVRVIIGHAYGVTSPVKMFAETHYFEAAMAPNQSLALPLIEERAVYVADGVVNIDGTQVEQYQMAVINPAHDVQVIALESSRIALIGGEKMAPRRMFWNFASTSSERIEQAKLDWKEGRFDKVPGDEDEFIPLPE